MPLWWSLLLVLAVMPAAGRTQLKVVALSIAGEQLDAQVELTDLRTPSGKTLSIRSGRQVSLSASLYLARIVCFGFATREELIEVFGDDVTVRIGLNPSRIGDQPLARLRGTIVSYHLPSDGLWVKLVPILNNQRIMEIQATVRGDFTFSGIAYGEYLLIVSDRTRLLATQLVSCYGETGVTVKMSTDRN